MTRINLLPWREARRADLQRHFLIAIAMTAVFALAIVGGVHFYLDGLLTKQNTRNSFLENEIAVLNGKLSKIRQLEAERKALLDRMSIIQELQATRPEVVHLFDEIPRRLPDGVYLKSMKQNGRQITLTGVAQSNARVSSFMRNLDQSDWFANPVLEVIKTVVGGEGGNQRLAEFTLKISQVNPQLPKDGNAAADNG